MDSDNINTFIGYVLILHTGYKTVLIYKYAVIHEHVCVTVDYKSTTSWLISIIHVLYKIDIFSIYFTEFILQCFMVYDTLLYNIKN